MMLIAIGRKGSLTVKTWWDQREKEKMWPKKRAVPCAATNAKIANCPSSFFGEERKGPLRGIIIYCDKRKIDLCHLFQIKKKCGMVYHQDTSYVLQTKWCKITLSGLYYMISSRQSLVRRVWGEEEKKVQPWFIVKASYYRWRCIS